MIVPRSEVADTAIAVHGGRRALHHGEPTIVYDFSVCLNAFGPADVVRRAVAQAPIDEYPDPVCRAPREAASMRWFRPVSEIAFGAGAAEFIHAIGHAYVDPGDAVVIVSPAFGEYERAVRLRGARVTHVRSSVNATNDAVNDGMSDDDVVAIRAEIERTRPRLVVLCAPTTPSGGAIALHCVRALADACEPMNSLLILDQAYDAFVEHPLGTPALPGHSAVLHLRSLTKEHALAGLRVAFAVGPAAVIDAIDRVRVPWSASSCAQAAAVAALTDEANGHVIETVRILRAEATRLRHAVAQLGFTSRSSATHYFALRVGDAAAVTRVLLDRAGIVVRDCTSFGLPEYVRVAARTIPDNDALLAALAMTELDEYRTAAAASASAQ